MASLHIADAVIGRKLRIEQILDDKYLHDLHRAMFVRIWEWAGTYRRRETNIGIDPTDIPTAVRNLVGDASVQSKTWWPSPERARQDHRAINSIWATIDHKPGSHATG